jgi:hypothetical protein
MISDGIDRFYGTGPDDPYVHSVVDAAQKAGIIIYSIYSPGVGHYGSACGLYKLYIKRTM